MNNETKIERYYNSAKLTRSIMLMEQFWLMSQNPNVSDDNKICAKALFEHYRRLAICILTKEMPKEISHELIIDEEYMKNIYKQYGV